MSISQPCCLTHKHWTMTMAYSVSMQQVAKVLKDLAVTTHPDQKKDLVQYLGQSTLRCLSHHWRRFFEDGIGTGHLDENDTGFQWIPMDWAWVIFRKVWHHSLDPEIPGQCYEKTVKKDRPSPTLAFSLSILATCPMGWWSQKTRKRGFLFVNVYHIGRPSTTSSVKPTPSAPGRPVMSCNAFRPCRPQIRTERSHLHMSEEMGWNGFVLAIYPLRQTQVACFPHIRGPEGNRHKNMPMQDLAALLHSKKLASECKRSVDPYFSACNMLCSRSPLYKKTFSIMSRMRGGSILNCRCPESAHKTIENVSKHQKPGKIAHVYFTYVCFFGWGSGSPFLSTLTVQGHCSGHLVDFFPSLQEFQSAVPSKDNGEASLLHVARDNAMAWLRKRHSESINKFFQH